MARAERLFQEMARSQDEVRDGLIDREQLKAELRRQPLPQREVQFLRRRGIQLALGGLAAAAVLTVGLKLASSDALNATISGTSAAVGAQIEAPASEALPLRFSDGTEIELQPATRAELLSIDERGAHVKLNQGELRVHVQKRPEAAWQISMGPYLVKVTGTRFAVSYEPGSEDFRLALSEGGVELSGCMFGDKHVVTAGQVVRASCKRSTLNVKSFALDLTDADEGAEGDTGPATPSGSEQEAAPEETSEGKTPPPHTTAKGPVGAKVSTWQALAAARKYGEAFAQAEAQGFEKQCAIARADDLLNLANAARYSGNANRSSEAFQVLRRRFPGTGSAALAAFSLGVLSFDARGSYSEAAKWFQTYLTEKPGGSLEREARGRLMEAVYRSGKKATARSLAVTYLASYPSGPHAKLARELVSKTGN
jgi:transmembrane sensor